MEDKNKEIIDYFYFLNKHNRINASYFFCGNNLELVLDIVKLVNCTESEYFCDNCDNCIKISRRIHPDILIVDSDKSNIKIETVREVQKFLHFKNFQSRFKALIINNAHLFTEAASNAFLKTLEESPSNSMIILVSRRPDLMLPTILSRCKKIYIPYHEENKGFSFTDILEFIKKKEINMRDRKSLSVFVANLISVMRDYISFRIYTSTENLINKGSYEIITTLDYSLSEGQRILDDLLRIYAAIDNVNVNLACNLLKLTFQV